MAEYGVTLLDKPHDLNSMRYVGWTSDIDIPHSLYSQETVNYISQTVTKYLYPIMKKAIIVPDEQIREMINSVWETEKGGDMADIYTKDTFDFNKNGSNRIVCITIQSITSQIKNQHEMTVANNSLDIWNQLYGDFNKCGLRAHSKIKLRECRPHPMQFHMNY